MQTANAEFMIATSQPDPIPAEKRLTGPAAGLDHHPIISTCLLGQQAGATDRRHNERYEGSHANCTGLTGANADGPCCPNDITTVNWGLTAGRGCVCRWPMPSTNDIASHRAAAASQAATGTDAAGTCCLVTRSQPPCMRLPLASHRPMPSTF